MKKLVLALTAVAAFTGSALAADMAPRYSKAPPPPPVAVVNWTGCYVGGGGGYGLFNQESTLFRDPPQVPVRTQATLTTTEGGRGYFGTVQGGCDYQFAVGSWNLVVGGFADYDFSDLKANVAPGGFGLYGQQKASDAWAAGGRIGVLVTPSLLTYFSAGYTEAKFDRTNLNLVVFPGGGAPNPATNFVDGQRFKGWFLGAGDEYALGFLPGLFWKTEYRFSRFDTVDPRPIQTIPGQVSALGGQPFSFATKEYTHTVRSELVYRFNWGGGGVVAKY